MTQALYRKWRPQTWEAVIGQQHVITTLRNALAAGRIAHAYLFAGPRGTGKTTTARLLAKAVNCLEPDLAARPCAQCDHCQAVASGRFLDLIEIDAASNTSVEDVRDLRDKINFSPNLGRYKVYIIDEVHMLSTAAFNALLKTLEEPPPHAIFILATTEVHKIPATVLSRCQRHEFRRIPVMEIAGHLQALAEQEGIQVEPEALTLIARQATGAMRDAISLLDQLASSGQLITLQMAQDVLGTAASQAVLNLIEDLTARHITEGLDHIHQALDAGSDPRQFARQVVDYLRDLLLVKTGNASQVDATAETRAQMARHAQAFSNADLLRMLRAFNQAASEVRAAWQPALPLEMAFVESLQGQPGEPVQVAGQPALPVSGVRDRVSRNVIPAAASMPVQPAKAVPVQDVPAGEALDVSESGSTLTLQMIQDQWKQITALVRQRSPNAEGLLRSSRLLGVKDGALYLGFASELLKEKMVKSENLELVCQALRQALGRDVMVHCIVATGKGNRLPPDVDSDGMVAAALRDLGGEIVDVQS